MCYIVSAIKLIRTHEILQRFSLCGKILLNKIRIIIFPLLDIVFVVHIYIQGGAKVIARNIYAEYALIFVVDTLSV